MFTLAQTSESREITKVAVFLETQVRIVQTSAGRTCFVTKPMQHSDRVEQAQWVRQTNRALVGYFCSLETSMYRYCECSSFFVAARHSGECYLGPMFGE